MILFRIMLISIIIEKFIIDQLPTIKKSFDVKLGNERKEFLLPQKFYIIDHVELLKENLISKEEQVFYNSFTNTSFTNIRVLTF